MGLKWEKSVHMQACKEYMIRACFAAVSFSKKADLSAASKNNKKKELLRI